MSKFEIKPNDACPCGSGKKWKKCHSSEHESGNPTKGAVIEKNPNLDACWFVLGNRIAQEIESLIRGRRLDKSNPAEMFEQGAIFTMAARAARAGRAIMALLYAEQEGESQGEGRVLWDSWISTMYFVYHRRRATLWTAYQPIKQRMEIDKFAERSQRGSDLKASDVYKEIGAHEQQNVATFPDLMCRPRNSTQQPKPRVPLDAEAMMTRLVPRLVPRSTFPHDVVTDADKRQYLTEQLEQNYFDVSKMASQEMHHTPLTLNTTLDIADDGTIQGVKSGYIPADVQASMFVAMLLDTLTTLAEYLQVDMNDRVRVLRSALRTNRERNREKCTNK